MIQLSGIHMPCKTSKKCADNKIPPIHIKCQIIGDVTLKYMELNEIKMLNDA